MRRKIQLTPQALFDWACAHSRTQEALGRGSQYPTFADAAKHFGVRLDAVEDACNDWSGPGYMAAGVAVRTGAGNSARTGRSQWVVEAYL